MENLEQKAKPSLKYLLPTGVFALATYVLIEKSIEKWDISSLALADLYMGTNSAGLAMMFGVTTYYALKKKITGKYPQNKVFDEIVSAITDVSEKFF